MTDAFLQGRGVVCAGNWIVDIVNTVNRWPAKSDLVNILHEAEGIGGGAANVAMGLAAFATGLPLYAVGLIGRDRYAQTVRAACRSASVDDSLLCGTDAAATAHTLVMNIPGDSRTFFYHAGANDLLEGASIPVEALATQGARLFYLGYLNLLARLDAIGPDGRSGATDVLARARQAGMITCVDLVSIDDPDFRSIVKASLFEIDYLFLNEIEATRATGLPVTGPDDIAGLEAAGRDLLAAGVRRGVILHSPAIALWLPKGGHAIRHAPELVPAREIVSPVGAGDAFCAGVIFGIHQEWTPIASLDLGHRAAAACLRSPTASGGIPPLAQLLRQGAIPA